MTSEKLVYGLLARVFLDIRVASYGKDSNRAFWLSDLFHNVPYRLDGAETEDDFKAIIEGLRRRTEGRDGLAAWLDHAISEVSCRE